MCTVPTRLGSAVLQRAPSRSSSELIDAPGGPAGPAGPLAPVGPAGPCGPVTFHESSVEPFGQVPDESATLNASVCTLRQPWMTLSVPELLANAAPPAVAAATAMPSTAVRRSQPVAAIRS